MSDTNLQPLWQQRPRLAIGLTLALILLIGAFFRFDDYASLLRFNNDQVRDIRIVEAMAEGEAWPLLGPRAGGTDFQLGPAFYYLEYLSGLLFGLTPVGTTLLIPILSLGALFLFYRLSRLLFDPRLALLLTLLSASSFFLVKYSRFGWNPNFLPFFLLLVFFALLRLLDSEERRRLLWYGIAGLAMAIGMQLHTSTLLLMPALFVAALAYHSFRTKRAEWRHWGMVLVIVLVFFTPVIASERSTHWANTRSFLSGIATKTDASGEALSPLLVTADFYLQGTAAVLTGFEPRGQWVNPAAWGTAFSPENTLLLILSIGITLVGSWSLITSLRSPLTPSPERRLLALLGIFLIFSLGFFSLMAHELNLRFFLILSPFPILFLGLTLRTLSAYLKTPLQRRAGLAALGMLTLILITANAVAYRSTYDFDHARSFTKAYGGISLGEARGLADRIRTTLQHQPGAAPRLSAFDYERSLQYFLDQDGIRLETIKERSDRAEGRFFIRPADQSAKAFEPFAGRFDARLVSTVGRFELYWLEPRR